MDLRTPVVHATPLTVMRCVGNPRFDGTPSKSGFIQVLDSNHAAALSYWHDLGLTYQRVHFRLQVIGKVFLQASYPSMRCHNCSAKWSLVDSLGPGGNASPGQYSSVAAGVAVVAVMVAWLANIWVGVAIGSLALLIFFMALCGCGHQTGTTAYQGSRCPECGQEHWIWPWNF